LLDDAEGGADTLTGGSSWGGYVINILIGDASTLEAGAEAGEDTLIAGSAFGRGGVVQNYLWGDAVFADDDAILAADCFVFGSGSGSLNFIMDFQIGIDTIEFDLDCFFTFEDLELVYENGNTMLTADEVCVTLVGFSGLLTEDTFYFI
jgi:hypothetical protein